MHRKRQVERFAGLDKKPNKTCQLNKKWSRINGKKAGADEEAREKVAEKQLTNAGERAKTSEELLTETLAE